MLKIEYVNKDILEEQIVGKRTLRKREREAELAHARELAAIQIEAEHKLADIRRGKDATHTHADQSYPRTTTKGQPKARREARKLDTQAIYRSWQRQLEELRKQHPYMSDVWYSKKIAELKIANGRSAETIRKHLKK